MKKALTSVLAVVLCISMVLCMGACGKKADEAKSEQSVSFKVGAVLLGDETETYTKAHMDGLETAVAELKDEGIDIELVYKKKVSDENVPTNAQDLVADGCQLVVCNSYGHQTNLEPVVKENPDVKFFVATGDMAATSNLPNYVNGYPRAYEARYVAGVVAGKKIEAMLNDGTISEETTPNVFDEKGNIKIGYVGAFNYAEVVSGYTAFYLGVKSVVENVSMIVKYANTWGSNEREAAVAEYLMGLGCVVISQHSDATGAATAVQKAYTENGTNCFIVGYNGSLLGVAPDVALTSATNNWAIYYKYLLGNLAKGEEVVTDWSKGYEADAVNITEFGKACADGTEEAVEAAVEAIKSGELKVFDCAKFAVNGENLSTYTDAFGMNGAECIKTEGDVAYFDDQTLRSAPYFDIRIDGITEEASDYND